MSLIQLFRARARAAPDSTAVADAARGVSYQELADLSAALASRLLGAGVSPGDVVGLAADRSIEWVVAVLAILSAGAIYLPLPPDQPRERRRLLASEAGVRHILRHPAAECDLWDGVAMIDIELMASGYEHAGAPELPCPAGGTTDRACVLFTSGSTGTPKGVLVRQSSIARLVVGTDYIKLDAGDVVAFASNTAFDAATFEVWGALLNGGQLIVIPPSTLLSPSALETVIRTGGVTTLFLTTELFNRIARSRPTAFRGVKWLLFGGEKSDPECVRAVTESGGAPTNLLHMYGPTECTTFATYHRVAAVPADATTVPIGVPISGCEVYLLDDALRTVPDGQEGELCIAGAGLAEGYFNRPEETTAAFVTSGSGGAPARIYRTGDRARRREDGLIEYIGRRDGQIKLRGFRIEAGEVEAALRHHPAVRDAIVLVYPGPGAAPRLGACLLMPNAQARGDVAAIRKFATEHLPTPMVPACLIAYDAFPLTASKKVDREQLLAGLREADQDAGAPCPENPRALAGGTEEKLAAVWQKVLGQPPQHLDENFFDAGGDSLQAVDLQLRIENEWKIVLSASALIEEPTFRQLADHIRRREAPDVRPVVWLARGAKRQAMACVPGVHGHVFFFRNLAPLWPKGWGLCALPSLYLNPQCDRRLLSLEKIAEENLARLVNAAAPAEAVAGYSFGGLVAYEMARRMAGKGEPPALILYDTASKGEHQRGTLLARQPSSLWERAFHIFRFAVTRALYPPLLRHGRCAPRTLFYPSMANLAAAERYSPKPYSGDALLVRSNSTYVPRGVDAETLGWGELVRGKLTVRSIDAEHADFFKPPHASEVAAVTIEYLGNRLGNA